MGTGTRTGIATAEVHRLIALKIFYLSAEATLSLPMSSFKAIIQQLCLKSSKYPIVRQCRIIESRSEDRFVASSPTIDDNQHVAIPANSIMVFFGRYLRISSIFYSG
jgi:hypothetical protein